MARDRRIEQARERLRRLKPPPGSAGSRLEQLRERARAARAATGPGKPPPWTPPPARPAPPEQPAEPAEVAPEPPAAESAASPDDSPRSVPFRPGGGDEEPAAPAGQAAGAGVEQQDLRSASGCERPPWPPAGPFPAAVTGSQTAGRRSPRSAVRGSWRLRSSRGSPRSSGSSFCPRLRARRPAAMSARRGTMRSRSSPRTPSPTFTSMSIPAPRSSRPRRRSPPACRC